MEFDEDEFENASVFAFANTVGRLCEIGDKMQNETFQNMVHDAALVCLQRIIEQPKTAELHVFRGRKQ